jgi:hypothetical protein
MKIQDDVYFNIYTEDKSVNTNNFNELFSNYIKDLYWLLDNNLGKHVEVFLKKVTIETDSGFFLSSKTSDFIHKFEHYDLDVVSNSNSLNRTYPLMKLILYASSQTQQIQRIYPKVQMIAAEVSGIVKIFSILCMALLSVYTSYKLTIFLINSEFDNSRKKKSIFIPKITLSNLKEIPHENLTPPNNQNQGRFLIYKEQIKNTIKLHKKNQKHESEIFSMTFTQYPTKMLPDVNPLDQKAKVREKLENLFSKNHQSHADFKFTFWDYVISKYCLISCFRRKGKLKNKKLKMFLKAQLTISSYFDARILIRKIIDIERMKKVLFSDEQLKVYEFLAKP